MANVQLIQHEPALGMPEEERDSLNAWGFIQWASDLTGRLWLAPDGMTLVAEDEARAAIDEYKRRQKRAAKKAKRR